MDNTDWTIGPNWEKEEGNTRLARGERIPMIANPETGVLAYKKTLERNKDIIVDINNSKGPQIIQLNETSKMVDILNNVAVTQKR